MPTRLNRSLLREEITKALLFESEAAELDDSIDSAESFVDGVLGDVLGDLEKIADEQETERVDEAGVALVAGAALAMPVIMKGIGKIATALQSLIKRAGSESDTDWEDWWSKKADELHHLYIDACKKIIDAAVKIAVVASGGRYKDPGEAAKKRAANVVFLAIIAIMAGSAGIGVASALQGKAYAVAGTETILGSIKLAEIQALTGELLMEILSFGAAEQIAGAVAGISSVAAGAGF